MRRTALCKEHNSLEIRFNSPILVAQSKQKKKKSLHKNEQEIEKERKKEKEKDTAAPKE